MKIRTNIGRASLLIGKIPNAFSVAAFEIADKTSLFALRSAKRRAPKATGMLAKGLKRKLTTKTKEKIYYRLIVDGGAEVYANAQERGFRKHVIPIEYLTMRPQGTYVDNPKGFVTVMKPRSSTGYFMGPALRAANKKVSSIASRILEKNFTKLRR
jgi:hypothetical protein